MNFSSSANGKRNERDCEKENEQGGIGSRTYVFYEEGQVRKISWKWKRSSILDHPTNKALSYKTALLSIDRYTSRKKNEEEEKIVHTLSRAMKSLSEMAHFRTYSNEFISFNDRTIVKRHIHTNVQRRKKKGKYPFSLVNSEECCLKMMPTGHDHYVINSRLNTKDKSSHSFTRTLTMPWFFPNETGHAEMMKRHRRHD